MVHGLSARGAVAFLFLFLFVGALWGKQVISVNGTYDFDGDGLSEFLTVEEADPGAPYGELTAFYEIDDFGSHNPLWVFTSRLPLIDARIADMDGDGVPEVVVLTGRSEAAGGDRKAGLLWFPWEDNSFSPVPRIEWSGPPVLGERNILSYTLIDSDNDARDEIAVAAGSPRREIVLLSLTVRGQTPALETLQTFSAPTISSGYGQIFLSTVDQNRDGFPDLLAMMRELASLKVQLFTNEGGTLVADRSHEADLTRLSPQFSPILASVINTIDLDQDGDLEVFLPFENGPPLAMTLSPDRIDLLPVDMEVASLFALPRAGIEPSIINEILLERAETGITGMRARKLQLQAMEMEVPPAAPEEPEEGLLEETPESPSRRVKRLELTAVEDTTPPPPPPTEPADTTALSVPEELPLSDAEEEELPTTPGRVRKLALTTLDKEAPTPAPVIPTDITPADTVLVGETYSHALEPDETKTLHAFRPSALPRGASFDPPSRTIVWTPSEDQTGIHRLAYVVEFQVSGERVNVEEVGGTGVQVLTTTETDTVEFHVLVRPPSGP